MGAIGARLAWQSWLPSMTSRGEVEIEAPNGYFEALPGRVRNRLRDRAAPRWVVPRWTWAAAAAALIAVLAPLTIQQGPDITPEPARFSRPGGFASDSTSRLAREAGRPPGVTAPGPGPQRSHCGRRRRQQVGASSRGVVCRRPKGRAGIKVCRSRAYGAASRASSEQAGLETQGQGALRRRQEALSRGNARASCIVTRPSRSASRRPR